MDFAVIFYVDCRGHDDLNRMHAQVVGGGEGGLMEECNARARPITHRQRTMKQICDTDDR